MVNFDKPQDDKIINSTFEKHLDIPAPPETIKAEEIAELEKDLQKASGYKEKKEIKKEKKEVIKEFRKEQSERVKQLEEELSFKKSIKQSIYELLPFTNSDFIQIGLIHDTGRITVNEINVHGETFSLKKGLYKLDNKAVYKYKGKPISFYFKGNPYPIKFDFDESKPLVDSESLYKTWNAKIVSDLLSGGGLSTTAKWTIGTIMAVGIVIVMIMATTGDLFIKPQNIGILLPLINYKNGKEK